jgi:two-component system, OmpR family, sensor kinase
MTVKKKITLLIAGAGFIASLLFSLVVFYELIEQPFELLDNVLEEEAYRTTGMITKRPGEPDTWPLDSVARANRPYWIEVYEPGTGRMVYQSGLAKQVRLSMMKPGSSAIESAIIPREKIKSGQSSSRKVSFRVRTFSIELDGRMFVVQIARPIEKLEEEIWDLVMAIFSGLLLSTSALIVISHFVAGKILRPIGRLKNLAQDISEKNLTQRIPSGEGQDEFSELTRTINRMLDRLQYSFGRQRDFLFDTSHELKTPLTTMRLSVDEMCAADMESLPSPIKDNLFRLKNQVLRIDRLVKDLLNLSSLETLPCIDPKRVDVGELLSSLTREYQFWADARNITINVDIPDQLIIQGDAEKLHRAFSNILDNAVKYNMDGGQIELTGDQSETELTVTVSNTGPGVAEAEILKVFDQFYRVEKSRSMQHGGSGLGLAIVKRIIDLHGGKVRLESEQDAWTRVTVSLPLDRDTADSIL